MSEKSNGVFVNLVRKAVGLPTGDSSCCSTPAATETKDATGGGCCSTAPAKAKSSNGCCD